MSVISHTLFRLGYGWNPGRFFSDVITVDDDYTPMILGGQQICLNLVSSVWGGLIKMGFHNMFDMLDRVYRLFELCHGTV